MANWFRIVFEHALSHAVPASLFTPLVTEMNHRGHPIQDFEAAFGPEHARSLGGNPAPLTEWALDVGGPTHLHEPRETIDIDGLSTEIPCWQVPSVYAEAAALAMRRFPTGEPYYKLKLWLHATVLTVEQYDKLLHDLGGLRYEAARRAEEFRAAMVRGMEGVS